MRKNDLCSLLLKFLFLFKFVYTDDSEVNYIVELINNGTHANVSPCENFYEHVCSSWNLQSRKVNFFQEAREKLSLLEKDLLESPINEADSKELSMEKEWLAKCVDARISNSDGYDLIKDIFDKADKLETWPKMNAYYAEKLGQNLLFDVDLNENNRLTIERPQGIIMLLPEIDSNFEFNVIKKINLLDAYFRNGEGAIKNDSVGDLVHILKNYIQRIKTMNRASVRLGYFEFQQKYDFRSFDSPIKINWLKQFNAFGLNVEEVEFFSFDSSFLLSYDSLCPAANGSQLIMREFIHFIYIMNDRLVSFWNPTQYALSPITISNICNKYMPIKNGIIQEIFYKRYAEKTAFFEKVFHNVKKAFYKELDNSWLSGNYRKWALQQLNQTEIILPGIYSHTTSRYTSIYDFNVTSCGLQNLINFNKAQIEYKVKKYRERSTRVKRDIHMNSAKDKINNYINIVAEHILTPLFSLKAPVAWNYGHIATLIGHELSHKVDDIHSIVPNRYINAEYYWDVECYIKKLNESMRGSIPSPQGSDDEIPTEIIADSVGLKVAYNALKKLMKKKMVFKEREITRFKRYDCKTTVFHRICYYVL